MDTNRCIDLEIGQKVLSYDLLEGEEKRLMDAHLEACPTCRDLLEQVYGRAGALDEVNFRAWKLGRRQRVDPSLWVVQRLRDLWLPLMLIIGVTGGVIVYLNTRSNLPEAVGIKRFAVARGGTLDSLASPHIDIGLSSLILRTDRDAKAFVYEVRNGTMRRLVPGGSQQPPELGPAEAKEVELPPIDDPDSRLLLLLVPREAPGTVDEWDAALFAKLSHGKNPDSGGTWPGSVRPTFRWYP